MAWPVTGDNENCVEGDVTLSMARMPGEPALGRATDTLALSIADGGFARLKAGTALDFDEDQPLAALGDEVDFAGRRLEAAGEDAVPFAHQKDGGDVFGDMTTAIAGLALGLELAGVGIHVPVSLSARPMS